MQGTYGEISPPSMCLLVLSFNIARAPIHRGQGRVDDPVRDVHPNYTELHCVIRRLRVR